MNGAAKLLFVLGIFAVSCIAEETNSGDSEVNAATYVTFFDDANHRGSYWNINLDWGVCANMPAAYNDRASSVNTRDNCIHIFEDGNCQGRSIRVAPGSGGHRYFGDDFNDVASSVSLC